MVRSHGLRGDVLLAAFIVWEQRKGPASLWAPYLRTLQKPATACDWGLPELEALWDPELVERAESRDRWVQDLHDRYFVTLLSARYPEDFPEGDFTLERFRLAWFVVQSRAWRAASLSRPLGDASSRRPLGGRLDAPSARAEADNASSRRSLKSPLRFGRKLKETALVPLADCLNHSADAKVTYRMRDGCFELYPLADGQYCKGKELLNTYGPCPNSKLLLDYGFALLDNPHEKVPLRLELRPDAEDPRSAACARWSFSGVSGALVVFSDASRRGVEAPSFERHRRSSRETSSTHSTSAQARAAPADAAAPRGRERLAHDPAVGRRRAGRGVMLSARGAGGRGAPDAARI